MGIDIHAFNFIKLQAAQHPLGKVLTIGRQSLDVDYEFIEMDLGKTIERTGYCEPLLLTLNAESVESLDISGYEGVTYVADLNQKLSIDAKFNTIIDSGSHGTTLSLRELVDAKKVVAESLALLTSWCLTSRWITRRISHV
jgi:hypothetical protein